MLLAALSYIAAKAILISRHEFLKTRVKGRSFAASLPARTRAASS
jgi:hypothetical protein